MDGVWYIASQNKSLKFRALIVKNQVCMFKCVHCTCFVRKAAAAEAEEVEARDD